MRLLTSIRPVAVRLAGICQQCQQSFSRLLGFKQLKENYWQLVTRRLLTRLLTAFWEMSTVSTVKTETVDKTVDTLKPSGSGVKGIMSTVSTVFLL